jgi:hypothetical protein
MAALPPDRVGLKHLQMCSNCRPGRSGPDRACSEQSGACPLRWDVPMTLPVDEQEPCRRELRPRARPAGRAPVARRRDGLLGLAATARLSEVATPHRFCARVMILVS